MGFRDEEYLFIIFILICFRFKILFKWTQFLRSSCTFFLSEAVVNIFSEAAARSLKNIEMFLEAATQKKKYQLHIFFLPWPVYAIYINAFSL